MRLKNDPTKKLKKLLSTIFKKNTIEVSIWKKNKKNKIELLKGEIK
jgi:hypothetical protein